MVGGVAVLLVTLMAVPAMAGKTAHFERSFPAAGLEEVSVDVSFHDVRLVVAPGDTIDVTVDLKTSSSGAKADKLLAGARPTFTVHDHALEIVAKSQGRHWWGSGNVGGKITIHLPPGRDLSIDTASGDCAIAGDLGAKGLEVDTASGDIHMEGSVANAEIETASGDVALELRRPGRGLDIETASGDVSVTGTVDGLDVETASGDVRFEGSFHRAELDTSSGDVILRLERVEPGAEASIESSSGDVELTVPANTAVAGLATTVSGEITSDLGRIVGRHKRALELTAVNPALRIEASTSSGDLSLKTARD